MNSQFFKNISTYIILIVPIILFSQKYNYSAKVDVNMDINQAIQISNTDAIYDDVGLH